MPAGRKTALVAAALTAALLAIMTLSAFVSPKLLLGLAGRVSGEMPWDGHIYFVDTPQVDAWPPRITLGGAWHTCGRGIEDFEEGAFLLDLPRWRVTPYNSAPESWPYWAVVLACPPGGTVKFKGTACGASESQGSAQVFVGYEVTDRTLNDDVAMIEVSITPDARLLDDHGEIMRWDDFIAAMRENPEIVVEVERTNDAAVATSIELR